MNRLCDSAGMTVFAVSPADDLGVQICKDWIRKEGLTFEDVKILKGDTSVRIESKRAIE